jgi:hypothetical protein
MDRNRNMRDQATRQVRRASDPVGPLLVLVITAMLAATPLAAAELEAPGFDMLERPEALTEQSKLALEQLSEEPRYKVTAEELLHSIWQAEITMGPGRIDESLKKEVVQKANDLRQMILLDPEFQKAPGFNCLNARAQCEPLGHAWFDCELAMVICTISTLGIKLSQALMPCMGQQKAAFCGPPRQSAKACIPHSERPEYPEPEAWPPRRA